MIVPTRTGSNAAMSARPTASCTPAMRPQSPSGTSVHWSICSTGTTSVWPGRIGAIVVKATTSGSRHTNRPGSSPAMMRENTEGSSAGGGAAAAGMTTA